MINEIILIIGAVIFGFFGIAYSITKKAEEEKRRETKRSASPSPVTKKSTTQAKPSTQRQPIASRLVESTHLHPSQVGDAEYRKPGPGSLGDINDEGCEEHNDIRFVTPIPINEDETVNYDEVAKMMIIGEALARPKYRNR